MNFFDAILTYRMGVFTAIKTRWIKFIILNVEIAISVKKNSKKKTRSTANTDGSSTASAAGSGASLIYFLPELNTIRNNLSSK